VKQNAFLIATQTQITIQISSK